MNSELIEETKDYIRIQFDRLLTLTQYQHLLDIGLEIVQVDVAPNAKGDIAAQGMFRKNHDVFSGIDSIKL